MSTNNPPEAPLTVQDILGRPTEMWTSWEIEAYQEAADHLYQAMQEVIGEDEDVEYERKEFGELSRMFEVKETRNSLRRRQRTRLNKLFGREQA